MAATSSSSWSDAASEVPSGELDAQLAEILQIQQMQHKQEMMHLQERHPVTNLDSEFRRALEQLAHDHLEACFSFATYEDSRSTQLVSDMREIVEDGTLQEEQHPLPCPDEVDVEGRARELDSRRRPNLNIDEASTSIADRRRPPPPILERLERWGAENAQDMINTMERQAREAELLALSSQHAVSMVDASFLQERSSPRSTASFPRRRRGLSLLLRRWRELEIEQEIERERVQNLESARAALRTAERTEDRTSFRVFNGAGPRNEMFGFGADPERTLHPNISGTASSSTELSDGVERPFRNEGHALEHQSEGDSRSEMLHIAPAGEAFLETNVRQFATAEASTSELMSQRGSEEIGDRTNLPSVDSTNARILTEGSMPGSVVQGNRQEGERLANSVHDTYHNEVEAQLEGFQGQSLQGGGNRGDRMLEQVLRTERVQLQNELGGLSQLRGVTAFASRQRLQAHLRERTGDFANRISDATSEQQERPSAGELGQLQQRRSVSGIGAAFRSRLESIVGTHGALPGRRASRPSDSRSLSATTHIASHSNVANSPSVEHEFGPIPGSSNLASERTEGNTSEINGRSASASASSPVVVSLQDLQRGRRGERDAADAAARSRRRQAMDDNVEIQELWRRRAVTNMLRSDFRARLDDLILSLITHRRAVTRRRTEPAIEQESWQNSGGPPQPAQEQQQGELQAPLPPPPPPPLPPTPLWSWPQTDRTPHHLQEAEVEGQLRAMEGRMMERMTRLEGLLEATMDMMLELQRGQRQELAGALNRVYEAAGGEVPREAIDGSKWMLMKAGVCCICCRNDIDSLLYKCGHMCACYKCGMQLLKDDPRCPLCRAPIREVVRAFKAD